MKNILLFLLLFNNFFFINTTLSMDGEGIYKKGTVKITLPCSFISETFNIPISSKLCKKHLGSETKGQYIICNTSQVKNSPHLFLKKKLDKDDSCVEVVLKNDDTTINTIISAINNGNSYKIFFNEKGCKKTGLAVFPPTNIVYITTLDLQKPSLVTFFLEALNERFKEWKDGLQKKEKMKLEVFKKDFEEQCPHLLSSIIRNNGIKKIAPYEVIHIISLYTSLFSFQENYLAEFKKNHDIYRRFNLFINFDQNDNLRNYYEKNNRPF